MFQLHQQIGSKFVYGDRSHSLDILDLFVLSKSEATVLQLDRM